MTHRPLDQQGTTDDSVAPMMPFLEHLEELRRRLLKAGLAIVLFAIAAFVFAEPVISFLIRPLGDTPLHVTEVTGAFYAYLKISLIVGITAALPIVVYQAWAFIAPGLYPSERRLTLPIVLASTLLFALGAAFCYVVVLPLSLRFLIDFGGGLFSPIITVSSYISFSGFLLLAFGLSFQLPILAFFLGKLGIVDSRMLGKGRRYAVVLILVLAAIVTPTPDVFTQLTLALPMYALYEGSILLVRATGRRN